MRNELILEILIESILYAADPNFILEERTHGEYEAVIKHVLEMAGPISDQLELNNIVLFVDEESEENQFLSNIKQLLGDKLRTTELF